MAKNSYKWWLLGILGCNLGLLCRLSAMPFFCAIFLWWIVTDCTPNTLYILFSIRQELKEFLKHLKTEENRLNLTLSKSRLSWHLSRQTAATNDHAQKQLWKENYRHELHHNWHIAPEIISWLQKQKSVPDQALPFPINTNYTNLRNEVPSDRRDVRWNRVLVISRKWHVY